MCEFAARPADAGCCGIDTIAAGADDCEAAAAAGADAGIAAGAEGTHCDGGGICWVCQGTDDGGGAMAGAAAGGSGVAGGASGWPESCAAFGGYWYGGGW
jgi:hypothetical protein